MAEAFKIAPLDAPPTRVVQLLKRTILSPRWLAILIAVAAWQVVAMRMNTRVIPTPIRVATTVWNVVISGLFFRQLAPSLGRITIGFTVSMLVGTTIGVLMGSRRSWEAFFKDLVLLGLALPGLIYALVSVVYFGLSIMAAVVAILATSYPFVVVNISEGVKALDKNLLDMCRAYQVGRWRVVRKVILPSLLPFALAAFRVGFAIAWKVCTLVEVFGTTNGVGYMIRSSFDSFSVHGIVAWALLFGAVMLTIEYSILLPAERHFARWRPKVEKVI